MHFLLIHTPPYLINTKPNVTWTAHSSFSNATPLFPGLSAVHMVQVQKMK